MTGLRQNYKVGDLEELTLSQKIIIELLLTKNSYVLAMYRIRQETGLSESTITKSVRFLRERGIMIGNAGFPRLNHNIIPKLVKGIKDGKLGEDKV